MSRPHKCTWEMQWRHLLASCWTNVHGRPQQIFQLEQSMSTVLGHLTQLLQQSKILLVVRHWLEDTAFITHTFS